MKTVIAFLGYALACGILAGVIMVRPAHSHDWYDGDCCHNEDCRPISGIGADGTPWSEITETARGYVWKSTRTGQEYLFREGDHLSAGGSRIRPSRDGFYHGCEASGGLDGYEYHPPAGLCIYVPNMF